MKKQIIFILLIVAGLCSSTNAQKLLKPFDTVSHKKTSYIYMENGKEIQGTVKKLKRKKGLVREINIKNAKGKKVTVPIEDIKYAYLPQSGLDKFMKFDEFIGDATMWEDGLYDKERIKAGYAYFEKAEVMVKKKKRTMLVQLLNPGLCSRVKVYHDPIAKEAMGVGVAGFKVAGGGDKSYYISKDGAVATKLLKKRYKKSFGDLFGDCKTVKSKFGKAQWSKFEEALFLYNQTCEK